MNDQWLSVSGLGASAGVSSGENAVRELVPVSSVARYAVLDLREGDFVRYPSGRVVLMPADFVADVLGFVPQ